MSTHEFIQVNNTHIENIDGNLDEASITLMGADGNLEFYNFVGGEMVSK